MSRSRSRSRVGGGRGRGSGVAGGGWNRREEEEAWTWRRRPVARAGSGGGGFVGSRSSGSGWTASTGFFLGWEIAGTCGVAGISDWCWGAVILEMTELRSRTLSLDRSSSAKGSSPKAMSRSRVLSISTNRTRSPCKPRCGEAGPCNDWKHHCIITVTTFEEMTNCEHLGDQVNMDKKHSQAWCHCILEIMYIFIQATIWPFWPHLLPPVVFPLYKDLSPSSSPQSSPQPSPLFFVYSLSSTHKPPILTANSQQPLPPTT